MTTVPVKPGLWWAVIEENGLVWHIDRTKRRCMEWAVGTFDCSRRWRYMRDSLGWSIRRVIVQAPEAER
jgi:hypothetical protein